MTCSFCRNQAPVECVFTAVSGGDGGYGSICQNCVRDLYIAMIAEEMLPTRPVRNQAGRSSSGRGHVVRLRPRKNQ
jgi:hypothetical protein